VSSKAFISNADWAIVDKKLTEIAAISLSRYWYLLSDIYFILKIIILRFRRALRGDTFAALSIRKSAFLVTKVTILILMVTPVHF
jgi:hypothetical protein